MKKLLAFAVLIIAAICTGVFAAKPEVTLSVQLVGDGTVTSAPAGINCPGQCTALFPKGTTVTLSAAPDSGQTFNGWGVACAGTDPVCELRLSADTNVSATFGGETFAGIVAVDGNGEVIGQIIGGANTLSGWTSGQESLQVLTKEGYDVTVFRSGHNSATAGFPSILDLFYYPDSQCRGTPVISQRFRPGMVIYTNDFGKLFYSQKDGVLTTITARSRSNGSCQDIGDVSISGYLVHPNDDTVTGVPDAGYAFPIRIEYR
jgi:hypothetical protein